MMMSEIEMNQQTAKGNQMKTENLIGDWEPANISIDEFSIRKNQSLLKHQQTVDHISQFLAGRSAGVVHPLMLFAVASSKKRGVLDIQPLYLVEDLVGGNLQGLSDEVIDAYATVANDIIESLLDAGLIFKQWERKGLSQIEKLRRIGFYDWAAFVVDMINPDNGAR